MQIPIDRLSPDALEGLIREFVTRDGEGEVPLASKIAAVKRQLERGEVAVVFDAETASCTIVTKEELKKLPG